MQAVPENKTTLILIEEILSEDKVLIKITDNGTGISAEIQENIFTPNFTTKTTGTGLGLVIAKESVALHGGDIVVQSRIGLGSSFTITLPITQRCVAQ